MEGGQIIIWKLSSRDPPPYDAGQLQRQVKRRLLISRGRNPGRRARVGRRGWEDYHPSSTRPCPRPFPMPPSVQVSRGKRTCAICMPPGLTIALGKGRSPAENNGHGEKLRRVWEKLHRGQVYRFGYCRGPVWLTTVSA